MNDELHTWSGDNESPYMNNTITESSSTQQFYKIFTTECETLYIMYNIGNIRFVNKVKKKGK